MSVDEFYDLTPIEFKYALKAVREREVDAFKTQYEVARYISFSIWNSAGKTLKGNGLQKIEDVGLFAWEVEEKLNKKQSVEEIKNTLFGIVKSFKGKVKTKK